MVWETVLWASLTVIGIIVTVVVGIPLVRRRVRGAEEERFSHAKNAMVEIIEECIVQGRDLDLQTIQNRLAALEKEHDVDLSSPGCRLKVPDFIRLASLRLEQSRHIVEEQKAQFVARSDQLLRDIEASLQEQPPSEPITQYQERLRTVVEAGQKDEAIKALGEMDSVVRTAQSLELKRARERAETGSAVFAILAVCLVAVTITVSVAPNIFEHGISKGILIGIVVYVIFCGVLDLWSLWGRLGMK